MSNWIGDSGNTSSAGEWDAGVPDSTHDAIFNAGSFSTTGLTVTVDAALSCKDMNWTGSTNTPTLACGAVSINPYGNVIFISDMVITGGATGGMFFIGGTNPTLTTNGVSIGMRIGITSTFASTLTLQDDLTITNNTNPLQCRAGTLNTNSKNITLSGAFYIADATSKTLTLGSSTISCTAWTYLDSNLTITANTATINCSGSFAGGSIDTYHIVNLTGATSTISGNNTFNTLALPKGTTQTITITDGSTQSAKTFTLSGDAKHTHTITGTATAGYTLTATGGGTVYMDYVNMSYCTATGATFLYGPHCTMTSCTGWKPAPRYSYFSGGRI